MNDKSGIIKPSWRETCLNCGVVNVLTNYAYCNMDGCLVLHHQIEQRCTNCNAVMIKAQQSIDDVRGKQ